MTWPGEVWEGWEPWSDMEADRVEVDWPADVQQENPALLEPPYDIETWEEADSMARALGYRHYDEYYWAESHTW